MNVYALYPSRKFIDAKTRTWVKFLRTHLPKVIARDEALLAEIGQLDATDDALTCADGVADNSDELE
jgi:hypothetical protein